jgi:hypothetical protein
MAPCLGPTLPLLVVVGTICLVLLKHERNVLVRSIALHLHGAHGSDVDELAPMTRKTWVDESCVADLKACYSTESSTVEVH